MTATESETVSVVVEREIAAPVAKLWRALTQPHLIEEWLMKNDFKPVVGHGFTLRGDWGSVDCQVIAAEPNRTLSYRWDAMGLESVVTWTLTPTDTGTHVRFDWQVHADRKLLKLLTPILRPALRWNHNWAIARAIEGLEPYAKQRAKVAV